MRNKHFVRGIVIAASAAVVLILLFTVGWNLLPAKIRGDLHFLTPRLTGRVVLCDGDTEKTFRFSSPGDYGSYEWVVGTEDHPITVELYNANNWYVTNMELRVERSGSEWIVFGTVNTDGEEPRLVSDTIPVGEPIVIDCGGL